MALLPAILAIPAIPAIARAESGHPYDDLPDSRRPQLYGDVTAGWRSDTTRVIGPGARADDAWGALFGLRTDLYSAPRDAVSARWSMDAAGGGGHYGDWRAGFDLTVGRRVELGGNSGLVVRAGAHAHSVGTYGKEEKTNARARDARIDLPVLELGYQRTHGLGLLELGVRNALTIYGYFEAGDEARSFTLKPGLGAYLAYHHDDVHLELDATRASIASRPVSFVNAMICTTASMFALCGEARYTAGAVDEAGQRVFASWHLGGTIGVGYDWATMR